MRQIKLGVKKKYDKTPPPQKKKNIS